MNIKHFTLSVMVLLVGYSCKTHSDKYHGYVYYKDKPLANVKVTEDWYNPARFTETDSSGHFELELKNVIGDLIFEKEGYRTDTVTPYRTHSGEYISYIFLNEKPDTMRLEQLEN